MDLGEGLRLLFTAITGTIYILKCKPNLAEIAHVHDSSLGLFHFHHLNSNVVIFALETHYKSLLIS